MKVYQVLLAIVAIVSLASANMPRIRRETIRHADLSSVTRLVEETMDQKYSFQRERPVLRNTVARAEHEDGEHDHDHDDHDHGDDGHDDHGHDDDGHDHDHDHDHDHGHSDEPCIKRTITLQGQWGEDVQPQGHSVEEIEGEAIAVDPHMHFFVDAMRWGSEEIQRSKDEAVAWFLLRFGVHLDLAADENIPGVYVDKNSGAFFVPFFFNFTMNIIADSMHAIDCPYAGGMWGGWVLDGDLTLAGTFAGPGGLVGEHVHLIYSYLVLAPGTADPTIISTKNLTPLICTATNLCPWVDQAEDETTAKSGFVDAVMAIEFNAMGGSRTTVNAVINMPGRF